MHVIPVSSVLDAAWHLQKAGVLGRLGEDREFPSACAQPYLAA